MLLTITSSAAALQDDIDALHRIMRDYTVGKAGPSGYQALSVQLRDSNGALAGGVNGGTFRGWLFVDTLVVREDLRGCGLGAKLLATAENEALRRGCHGAYLDTFSSQASLFHKNCGYRIIGSLSDFPPGGTRYWLSKRLTELRPYPPDDRVAYVEAPTSADFELVKRMLKEVDASRDGGGARWLYSFLRDTDDGNAIVGGVEGVTFWEWLAVKNLAIREEIRGQGYGAKLLAIAEDEARARDCRGVYLYTYSFQAPQFYLKLGYVVFAEIPDFPMGHTRHWLWKRLT